MSEPAPKVEPQVADHKPSLRMKESFALGDFRYVINKATLLSGIGNSLVREVASPGAVFVVVDYEIQNLAKETRTVLAGDLELLDAQGRKFRPSSRGATALAMSGEQQDILLSELHPGLRHGQTTVFEVPEDSVTGGSLKLVVPEKGLLGTKRMEVVLGFD